MMFRASKLVLTTGICFLLATQVLRAEDPPKKDAPKPDAPKKEPAKPHHPGPATLGVYVSSAHPALAKNLGELLTPEQGLIVEELIEHSPAAKAGIKAHDILTTYDDQKLFSAEQLAKLVHTDKPGREVTVGYLRDGKLLKAQVKLGELESPKLRAWVPSIEAIPYWFGVPRNQPRGNNARRTHAPAWENFDSLSLKKLGDNKFRAEVEYLDKAGKTQKHVFEGTRDEIKKAIEAENDLKPAERTHLLRSLNLSTSDEELLLFDIPFNE